MLSKKPQTESKQTDLQTRIAQWLGYCLFLLVWFAFSDATCCLNLLGEDAPGVFVHIMPLVFSLVSLLVLGFALIGVKDIRKVYPLSVNLNREIVSKELNRDQKHSKDLFLMFIFYLVDGVIAFIISYKLTHSLIALPTIGGYGLFVFGFFSLINIRKTVKPTDIAFRTDIFTGITERFDEEAGSSSNYLTFQTSPQVLGSNLTGKPTCYDTLVSNTGNPLSEGDTVYVVYKVKNNDVLRIYPANEFHF